LPFTAGANNSSGSADFTSDALGAAVDTGVASTVPQVNINSMPLHVGSPFTEGNRSSSAGASFCLASKHWMSEYSTNVLYKRSMATQTKFEIENHYEINV
jgi:hypothetical protein